MGRNGKFSDLQRVFQCEKIADLMFKKLTSGWAMGFVGGLGAGARAAGGQADTDGGNEWDSSSIHCCLSFLHRLSPLLLPLFFGVLTTAQKCLLPMAAAGGVAVQQSTIAIGRIRSVGRAKSPAPRRACGGEQESRTRRLRPERCLVAPAPALPYVHARAPHPAARGIERTSNSEDSKQQQQLDRCPPIPPFATVKLHNYHRSQ